LAQDEITDEQLQNIHNVTEGLSLDEAFRCGLFFPNPKSKDFFADEPKPVAPLFIFNATWPAPECEGGEAPDMERFVNFCYSIWKKVQKKMQIKHSTKSIRKDAKPGVTIGDDICHHLKVKVKAPVVGGKRSKKFPGGLEWAMYANACGKNNKWVYAGIKHDEKVCCNPKKKNFPCSEVLE